MIIRPIIEATNLSKRYRLGEFNAKTFREEISGLLHRQRKPAASAEVWALRDLSFSVQPGEVVGIIGRNGAGKSTLLKVLSRITKPTAGEVRLRGRVACLIEVGTGFHPEMTGRENVFLNGAILGMTKAEVRSKFDEIAAFAEIDRFLDTPVKRYSTGMRLRLGFAVAAHLEPEILLVDEVLAVGDAAFQKKCLGKMNDLSDAEGRTVLYVSHDLASVAALCSRAMLLKDGQIAATGAPDEVIRAYTGMLRDYSTLEIRTPFSSDILDVLSVRLTPDSGSPVTVDSNVSVETVVRWKQPQAGVAFEIFFSTADGRATFAAYSSQVSAVPGVQRFCCYIPRGSFNNGYYVAEVGLSKNCVEWLWRMKDALQFEVENKIDGIGAQTQYPGVCRPACSWNIDSPIARRSAVPA